MPPGRVSASPQEGTPQPQSKAPDPPALVCIPGGFREYSSFSGDSGSGMSSTFPAGGALIPTNYKVIPRHRTPWPCPVNGCGQHFPQCASLGRHFSAKHRGEMFYDDLNSGRFWLQGIRSQPDKDGVLRPIVIAKGFGPPGRQNIRQVPVASPVTTAATPASATRSLPDDLINLRIDDVKPVIAHTPVGKTAAPVASQQKRAGGGTSTIRTSPPLPRIRNPPIFEPVNPEELGGAYHQKKVLERWRQEAAERGDDSLSSPDSEETDDEILSGKAFQRRAHPAPRNNATEQQKTSDDTATDTPADTKQTPDSSNSEIWRYLMTLTKSEIPVPDDPAIMELLTLPKRRPLTKQWQQRISFFNDFRIDTLTGLILYVGGVVRSSGPCEHCIAHPESHLFWSTNFVYGRSVDHRFPFPRCAFLPDNLRNSLSITERLRGHLCCNAFYRSWKMTPHWKIMDPNDSVGVARDAAGMGNVNNPSTDAFAATKQDTDTQSTTVKSVASTSRDGNDTAQPSSSLAVPHESSHSELESTVRDTDTTQDSAKKAISRTSLKDKTESTSRLESSPANPSVGKKRKGYDEEEKGKMKKRRKSKHQHEGQAPEEEHSPTKQAHAPPASSAAAPLSDHTTKDTLTTLSVTQQQGTPGQTKNGGVFNVAADRPESLGLKGDDSRLLQASKKQSLECKVWAGSVRIKPIGAGSMGDGYKVSAGEVFTINPDSLCLVSNFFPETGETAVVGIKSKLVIEISE